MADLTRVRDPLEIAAASPDAKIRHMAIRRKEMELEMKRLDAFFEVYAGEPDTATQPQAKVPLRAVAPVAQRQSSAAKPGVVGSVSVRDAVKAILLREGPLEREALLLRYRETVPADAGRTSRSLRDTLAKHGGVIGRVSAIDARYWVVGLPVPEASAAA